MNTFERREVKFIVPIKEVENIVSVVQEHVHGFNEHYTVCNIYYDTDDFVLIRRSIDKPLYKEKLRVRSYGVPEPNDNLFVEVKKKYNKIVYKRRLSIESDDFDYSINGLYGCQIGNEIAYLSKIYEGIEPKIYLSYDRTAYNSDDIRISFDDNITYREYDLELEKGIYGDTLLDNAVIMEVKINGAIPLWLSHLLNEKHIYKQSFSKVGNIYKKIKGEELCYQV
jgi:SPX domain protein involved in polyphosphate accumulation